MPPFPPIQPGADLKDCNAAHLLFLAGIPVMLHTCHIAITCVYVCVSDTCIMDACNPTTYKTKMDLSGSRLLGTEEEDA